MGIAGSGASAVAAIALAQGYSVTGCDQNPESEFTKNFESQILFEGHSENHLKPGQLILSKAGYNLPDLEEESGLIDILAVSPAILAKDPDNPEVRAAREKGIKVISWQEFMGEYLEKDKFVIAVCGTHGKSTTTAMAGLMLEDAGLDPTVELGAIIPKWKTNYRIGKSRYFVTEADEFNNNFLVTSPDIAIITNVEMDHPEFFKDFDEVKQSYLKFLYQAKKKIIANMADPGVREVMEIFQKDKEKPHHPELLDYSKSTINLELKVPGKHNIQNATAVLQLGLTLGIDSFVIQKSLMSFSGISRRLELLGQFNGADIYSDFAHHPTEVKLTTEALREKYPDRKIWLIYQPHMFSRTKALFDSFVKVFQNLPVEQILLLDIYAAREKDTGKINSKMLVDSIKRSGISYVDEVENLPDFLKLTVRKNDILLFMGAGDIDRLARSLIS